MDTHSVRIRWGTSRGRDTYGYTTCSLWVNGRRVAACNGGGYDMTGTVFGLWIAHTFAARLLALKPDQMPERNHWQRAENPRRICRNEKCPEPYEWLDPEQETCPKCGEPTEHDYHDGKRIDDGRYFYGLTFHDPNYDPSKAVIGTDCDDRTLGKEDSTGKTVEEAETASESFGLERYQAFYRASSKVPSECHTVPLIDGACGIETVRQIFSAVGGSIHQISRTSKETWYTVTVAESVAA